MAHQEVDTSISNEIHCVLLLYQGETVVLHTRRPASIPQHHHLDQPIPSLLSPADAAEGEHSQDQAAAGQQDEEAQFNHGGSGGVVAPKYRLNG